MKKSVKSTALLLTALVAVSANYSSVAYGMGSNYYNPISRVFSYLSTSALPSTSYSNIGIESAKSIALKHAGLTSSQVVFTSQHLEYDDGRAEYDIEFHSGTMEYEYSINPTTGVIISYDQEVDHVKNNNTKPTTTTTTASYITQAKAKSIALASAGLREDQVTFITTKLGYDDGVAEYDVEFYNGNTEYDYEINAITGAIISYDYDVENSYSNSTPSQNSYISQDRAKSIALANTGLRESQVTFTKAQLGYDDGVAEYDVEFYSSSTKYEYEINATTGSILSYDYEGSKNNTNSSSSSLISSEEAISIALNHSGISQSQATKLKTELDSDDGITEYEVEWEVGRTEYEYTISAHDGSILDYDIDND